MCTVAVAGETDTATEPPDVPLAPTPLSGTDRFTPWLPLTVKFALYVVAAVGVNATCNVRFAPGDSDTLPFKPAKVNAVELTEAFCTVTARLPLLVSVTVSCDDDVPTF